MKNSIFIEYATSVGFRIELTKAQLRTLIGMCSAPNTISHLLAMAKMPTYHSLAQKGLIQRTTKGDWEPTKAGRIVFLLLKEADLVTSDKTQLFSKKKVTAFTGVL